MRVTAPDLLQLEVVDEIVPEVTGGAHVDHAGQAKLVGDVLERQLRQLDPLKPPEIVANRYERFRRIGVLGS
jgi:acetyl-CoA carboxylase carboxyl transferase subunit alpha